MSGIVGRERELAAVEGLVRSDEPQLAALVIEGEPGIGKSTLWQAGIDAAATAGLVVLRSRTVQAEAQLSFASLADLLDPIVDGVIGELPQPQRIAIEVALLRSVPQGRAPDRRAVATAVHSLLRRLAAETPVLLAIDDVQWLDRASEAVLAFALRRLDQVPLRVLLARRPGSMEGEGIFGLDRRRVTSLRLGPLSLAAIHHVIRAELGLELARPTLRRVMQACDGNPLFALELARALAETGARPGPGEPLPVPATLSALLGRRLSRLTPDGREALLVAASLANPERELIVEALGSAAGLDSAESWGVIVSTGGRILFSHPLLASTVSSSSSAAQRRAVHRRLAEVVRDQEGRARHLALAASAPDGTVAREVDSAARAAELRGALEVAVELAQLARELTPEDSGGSRDRRTVRLAELIFRAGDTEQARELAEGVLARQPEGRIRADALELLARILHVAGTASEAVRCCQEALAEVGDDASAQARIHATLACVSWSDFELARRHSKAALDLLEGLEDPDAEVLGLALLAYIEAEYTTGRGLPWDAVERALALERISPAPSVADRMTAALGVWLKFDGDFDGARRWLETAYEAAVVEGDEGSLPYVVGHLPQLELWTGNWPQAELRAREHLELSEAMAQPDQRRQALYNLALVHAHLGRVEEARREAEELLAQSEQADDSWGSGNALSVLGFLELSLGNMTAAAEVLERNLELCEASGRTEPLRSSADLAEALIELGRLDDAEAVIKDLEERAGAARRVPLQALGAACRGRLEGERQNPRRALEALEQALALHERVLLPFDRARTELTLGRVRRRAGERRAAKDALASAIEAFERLGATLWSARAQAELARIPLRRGAPDTLTATEAQVAELAAQGKTNREVAQALFMSAKTVEANLGRVYRKLGIRSRAELGATMTQRLAGDEQPKT